MTATMTEIMPDQSTGGLTISGMTLHPLWLRERVTEPESLDHISNQRLYEHSDLDTDIRIVSATIGDNSQHLNVCFSDGYKAVFNFESLTKELGLSQNPEAIPLPQSWTADLDFQRFDWAELNDPDAMKTMLTTYFENAFCIMDNVPSELDSLKDHARRFGFIRVTNFGELFNVETKPLASDVAYTDSELASHTDNPYRLPVPGIQYLHCLTNEVDGGLSTLVDGMAVAEAIANDNQDWADILENVPVRFRYEGPTGIYEDTAPLISRDHRGLVNHIRFSSRVDFVPALEPEKLTLFYNARRRMHQLCNDPAFKIKFPFKRGTLLMMNNYRLFHGRTAFDGKQGHRHLQGCYIDHDGPQCLYRMLANGHPETHIMSEDQ